ncbi:adhesive plaque matrix protein-like [Condylostylus longicornis]|uniref:adhesive plaque matrix protein-like n=1 Tax=Condylostylus longicornis TaxID=2530218 RepID=UPI00244E4F90|nr:adhesive plaque matrix protein-like [Condylostylus longicornis]
MWNKLSFLIIGLIITNCVYSFPQAPQQQQQQQQHAAPIEIISKSEDTLPDGSFNSSYESSDGTRVENHGYFKRIQVPQYEDANGKVVEAHEEDVFVQTGSYSYYDPEGNVIQLQYIADENGFQPTGDHLPKPTEQVAQQQQQQQQYQQELKSQQQHQQLHQDRPIQNQYTRRTRQSYYTAEPGLGIVENRPINDYRPSSSLPYSTNPLRYIRQQLYQDRPIYQGYYPSNGGLSSVIQSRPSYYPGYNQNGGLSTTVISRPSYPSYSNGGLSETIHTSPSTNYAYYQYYNPNCLPNSGLSENIETKPSYSNGGLSTTIVTKPSSSLCYYPNNGGISESIITNPSYNSNGGLSQTVISKPSYPNSNGGGISETVETKPSYNPCIYYPGVSALQIPPNQHPCYNQNGGISESIITSPSYNPNSGIGETIESKPSSHSSYSTNEGSSTTQNSGGLISGNTNDLNSHDISKFHRLGSIDNIPTNTDTQSTTTASSIGVSSHISTTSS